MMEHPRRIRWAGILLCLLLVSGALVLLNGALTSFAQEDTGLTIELVPRVGGLSSPLYVTAPPDQSDRLFIVEQPGRIRIYENGTLLSAPFLDISGQITSGGERGLLGLAFPPTYAASGQFYVYYTDTGGDTVVSRFHLSGNPNVADPSSEEILLTVDQPFSNHNGGHITFGPDGYLYIALGDGGSGGDPQNNGQDLGTLLGKLLRIDVESGAVPYAIPPDNPFVGVQGAEEEIWAWGLRNPWRFSFDRDTGDLYIGDVGQGQWEEIDFQPASSSGGENYGWRCYEGNHAYNLSGCGPIENYVFPIIEYNHSAGRCSVTGGYVYRGSDYPGIDGLYFFADYCSGDIWAAQNVGGSWEFEVVADAGGSITSFGEDEAGRLYVVSGGQVYELTSVSSSTYLPIVLR